MDPSDEGRFLPRGGKKIEIDKTEGAFTVNLRRPEEARRLESDDAVAAVQMLTPRLAKVTVAAPEETADVRDRLMDRLRQTDRLVVHHEYMDRQNPEAVYQITPEILLKFRADVSRQAMAAIIEKAGVVIKKSYPELGSVFLVTVTDAAGANPVKVANRLEAHGEVDYAEPALVNRLTPFDFPSDDQFPFQWHLYSKDASAPDIDPKADASVYPAWQITKGSREVVVAVLDDGFELSHPDFGGIGKVVDPVDFTGNDTQPLPESGDYHGTPCAGVAIAEENGQGCVGAAPACAFMPVRFPLGASDPWLIEIFRYVSQRAHIASCSWGMIPGNYPLASAVHDTFTDLARTGGKDGRGLTIVFAAGNYDAPLDAVTRDTIRWLGWDDRGNRRIFTATGRIVNGFAAHPDTVTVSAITSLNKKALYSNWGREVSVAAPSNNFDPTTYERLPGRGITTTDNEAHGDDFTPGKRYTHSFGGTSSATPLVSGICALVKSVNPALTAPEIKEILQTTADKVADPSTDPLYGHAKGTYQNGHSEWFGYGKINGLKAVQEAAGRLRPQRVIEKENPSPLAVPDYFAPGVSSPIEIGQGGPVAEVAVTLDIAHTWIGDLEVALVSPGGTRVRLHNRGGGSADNLRRTYTATDTAALGGLIGEEAAGTWLLQVADHARYDTGTLNSWSLRLVLGEEQVIRVRTDESRTIPDSDPGGIASSLTLERDGRLSAISVSVDITHTWVGDLRVALETPTGQEVVLRGRSGGSADNLMATYTHRDLPALDGLVRAGGNVRGRWTLKVADLAQADVGKLNSWGLELSVGGPA